MLTAAQVAKLLGVSPATVRGMAGRALPCYRFGGALRFAPADVDAYRRTLPADRPSPTARDLREYARLRNLAPDADDLPALSAEQQAIVDLRRRRMRMPPWACGKAIRAIYTEARRRTLETGVPHTVDHVIPLQGALVSGLHVETNLQIITGSENSRKGNRFTPC